MTTTKENLANPGPVGLCGFALTTWLLSLINGGFYCSRGCRLSFGHGSRLWWYRPSYCRYV